MRSDDHKEKYSTPVPQTALPVSDGKWVKK
jgi:hypothetical protein